MNTSQRPDGYDQKVYAQISDRLDADLKAVMTANDCDRSTAIRSVLRVGIMHSQEVAEMVERDKAERKRRMTEASRTGGRIAMRRRYAKKYGFSEDSMS